MKLLSVVLLLLPLSLCLDRVDFTDFTNCKQFFANLNPPTGFTGDRFKQICQTRNNQAEFATLYDTENKIPVYSAYRFTGIMKCTRTNKWNIEPQLENVNLGPNMDTESAVGDIDNQAKNTDYVRSGYDRGHLAPVYLANSQSCADATFTLTNAAPQNPSFNKRWFTYAESNVAKDLNKYCITAGLLDNNNNNNRAFVVTGVVPCPDTGNNNNNNVLNNRVRIPSHFWTAFCCLDNNNEPIYSGAYIGENRVDSDVYRWNVKSMEKELKRLYNINNDFSLFGGKCGTETEPKEKEIVKESGILKKRNRSR